MLPWQPPADVQVPCTVAVEDAAALNGSSLRDFGGEPLLVRGGASDWPAQWRWTREHLAAELGNLSVGPACGERTLGLFLGRRLQVRRLADQADPPPSLLFEPIGHTTAQRDTRLRWAHLQRDVRLPALFSHWAQDSRAPALTGLGNVWLAIGGSGSGQSFHSHGEAFSALVWGRKRWFFVPASDAAPDVDGLTSLEFARRLPELRRRGAVVAECVQEKGSVMAIPAGVPHAVLNYGDTVSISVDRVEGAGARVVR